jgi:hypothetical protein
MRRCGWKRLLIAPLVIAAVCGVFGFLVKALWNALLPPVFGWHTITFWQGAGIFVLSKILFSGPRFGGGMGWRRGMRERWESMTPGQRENLREVLQRRGGPPAPSTSPEA